MKTTLSFLVLSLLVISVIPGVLATDTGIGIGIGITTEDFEPRVWMCDSRIVYDDYTQPGRQDHLCVPGTPCELIERINNYAFEGEQVAWEVLVLDKNGLDKIQDVYGTIGSSQGAGNDIEVNCDFIGAATNVDADCNAFLEEEDLTGTDQRDIAGYWECILTVETPVSMDGEYWVTVEAEDFDGNLGTMDENEYWFFNPDIALSVDGDLTFDDVRPGTFSYSDTLLVGNDAEESSGVLMDMFISGSDFYDSDSYGTSCLNTFTGTMSNQLILGDGDSDCDVGPDGPGHMGTDPFCYFATSGAYSSQGDNRNDAEGYVGINYAITFGNSPLYGDFYGAANGDAGGYEIIQSTGGLISPPYFSGNILTPGAEHAVTFRLALPEPCNGDFDTGAIYFWGEAI